LKRFPRFFWTAGADAVQRQEAQIVQSCNTLDDSLPGLRLLPVRWSDIDIEGGMVRWRAKHEKTGHEHHTPLTAEALAALEDARRMNPGRGNGPVLPAPTHPSECLGRYLALRWWYRAVTLAGLEPKRGRGWHSLRRKFASDLMDQPLKVLCELGGWRNARTVLTCYQQADTGQLRKALESRRRARA